MARSERVKMMVDHLYDDHEAGLTLRQIEKKYGVSEGYSYNFLDEVAKKHNVTKEYLLERPHSVHVFTDKTGRIIPNKSVSFKEIQACLNEAEELLNKISANLLSLKEEMEKTLEEIEKEI